MNDSEKQTIVFIPRNFIEKGTFMGGMFKIRNAIEGGILAVLIAVPVIQLPLSLTVRIIILCMTALPAAMISLIGIGGESISAFLMNALRFLKNRRVIYRIDVNPDPKNKHRIKKPRNKEPKAKKHKHPKKKSTASMTASGQSDEYEGCVSDEISSHDVAISKKKERRQFDTSTKRGIRKQAREDIRILKYENRQLKKAQKQAKRAVRTELKRQKQEEKRRVREENRQKKAEIKATKQADKEREHPASDINTAPASSKPKKKKRRDMTLEDYLPIEKIANGVIYTTDHRYVKILEIEPINFLLRSTREQQSIIFSFISYLKISPVKLQIKMISKKADINKHLNQAQLELERETDPNCRQLQKDYIQFVRRLSSREAVSRRFFLIFEYEPFNVNRKVEETEILAALETAAQTAKTFLYQCGNEVVSHDNEDEFTTDVLYTLLNRTKSTEVPLPKRINQVLTRYEETGREAEMDAIHINEFIAPESVDFKHSNYVLINGVYHAYLLVPSDGYKPKVAPGWLSLLINAGEGIDVDFYLHKQPKDKIQQRLGQQIRINRSKIKDASDTNADFDDLDSAIRSGYFLKQGLSNNEDFYYPDMDEAAQTAAILCDNVYRRIRYGDTLPSGNIKNDIPAKGLIQRLTPLNIQKGVFAPTDVIQGTFQVLKSGVSYKRSHTAILQSDFVSKYILSESRTLTPQEELTVPILEDWYIIPKEIQRICEHAKLTTSTNQPMRNFLLRGPAGTGKTEGAKAIAAGMHLPYRCITCSANTEIFDLLGQILPDVDGKMASIQTELPSFQDIMLDPATAYEKLTGTYDETVTEDIVYQTLVDHIFEEMHQKYTETSKSQRFRYVDTPLVEAIRNGYLVEIQEPTVIANPGVLVGLNSLLDRCNSVFLPNGEVIKRHSDTVIVVTTNNDYAGCRPMNQSVISRMNLVIDMDEPDEDTMIERVLAITGCSDKKSVRTMAQIVRSIAQYCQDNLITDGCCGIRELIAWVQSFMVCGDLMEAAHYTILSSVTADTESRLEIEGSCLETVIAA